MKKKEMIEEMLDFANDDVPVLDEYKDSGYSYGMAKKKTIEWYAKNYSKDEIKDMYDEFMEWRQ